MFIYWYL